jgi:hypothetical protein
MLDDDVFLALADREMDPGVFRRDEGMGESVKARWFCRIVRVAPVVKEKIVEKAATGSLARIPAEHVAHPKRKTGYADDMTHDRRVMMTNRRQTSERRILKDIGNTGIIPLVANFSHTHAPTNNNITT